ncbi:MAG: methyltransferase [Clostridia bacterium]|nr:methyltransferase [Clostridia bacterium]
MDLILKDGESAEELFEGKIIIQNTALYRFTSDSILLSRFAKGKLHDNVADFCAGSGAVGFHFLCLNPHINSLTLFELQPSLADMARRTAEYNGFNSKIVEGRVQDIGAEYDGEFSLILCNPPYERGGFENVSYEKAICRKEITVTLSEIIAVAAKKLKFGGRLALVNRADRLAETFYTMKAHGLEPKRMQFIKGGNSAVPYAFMAEAVKGGKPALEILPELVNTPQNGGSTK